MLKVHILQINCYLQGNFSNSFMMVSFTLSNPVFGPSVPDGPVPVPPRPVPSGLAGAAGVVSLPAEARIEGCGTSVTEGSGGALLTRRIRGSMANPGISGVYLLSCKEINEGDDENFVRSIVYSKFTMPRQTKIIILLEYLWTCKGKRIISKLRP
jgi:hypothetical protein